MTKRLEYTPWRPDQATRTVEHRTGAVSNEERPVKIAHVDGSGQEPDGTPFGFEYQEKGTRDTRHSSVEPAEEPWTERGEEAFVDLAGMEGRRRGRVGSRPGSQLQVPPGWRSRRGSHGTAVEVRHRSSSL